MPRGGDRYILSTTFTLWQMGSQTTMFGIGRFANATGQRWKYRVGLAATAAAITISVAFFSLWRSNPADLPVGLTTAIYFPVCTFWFVWLAAAIRCPACGTRIGWYHMNHGSASDATERITMANTCPACGFVPSTTEATSGSLEQS